MSDQDTAFDGQMDRVRLWLELTVQLLLDRSSNIDASMSCEGSIITFILTVSPRDVGKIIGRNGRIARDLRGLLASFASKHKLRYDLDIRAQENDG